MHNLIPILSFVFQLLQCKHTYSATSLHIRTINNIRFLWQGCVKGLKFIMDYQTCHRRLKCNCFLLPASILSKKLLMRNCFSFVVIIFLAKSVYIKNFKLIISCIDVESFMSQAGMMQIKTAVLLSARCWPKFYRRLKFINLEKN